MSVSIPDRAPEGVFDLSAFVATIGEYQARKWPTKVTVGARIRKVMEELGEVSEAENKDLGHAKLAAEIGDLFVTVCGLAFVAGVDLAKEASSSLEGARRRFGA